MYLYYNLAPNALFLYLYVYCNEILISFKLNKHMQFDKINSGVIQNGKRFAFCQNEYILRTSCVVEEMHMENLVKGRKLMTEIIVGIKSNRPPKG